MTGKQRRHGFINGGPSSSKQKCFLWDPVEKRHDEEVRANIEASFIVRTKMSGRCRSRTRDWPSKPRDWQKKVGSLPCLESVYD